MSSVTMEFKPIREEVSYDSVNAASTMLLRAGVRVQLDSKLVDQLNTQRMEQDRLKHKLIAWRTRMGVNTNTEER
jgi:hypothetical protein